MRRAFCLVALLFAATAVEAQRRGNARIWSAVDCTALTQGQEGEFCDDGAILYICRPDAGGICDTAGEWEAVASSGSGDITSVGTCLTLDCFQNETARHAFLAPVAGGIATFRAITEADISDLAHTVDTTCLDAGVDCPFAGSATEGGPATTALALNANPAKPRRSAERSLPRRRQPRQDREHDE